jgi:hypothetical protein
MTKRPILFNTEMVRAILRSENPKTQTRRPMKKQKEFVELVSVKDRGLAAMGGNEVLHIFEYSPFGRVGDTLWVRESATVYSIEGRRVKFEYDAYGTFGECTIPDRIKTPVVGNKMPNGCFYEASRINLKVKRVWVELIHDISEKDAKAEGVDPCFNEEYGPTGIEFRNRFQQLWNSIYNNWQSNPWVWACEFERIESKK